MSDGCPGPNGAGWNRTAEAITNSNRVGDRMVPKLIGNNGGRENIPSLAGNINIGLLNPVTQAPQPVQPRPVAGRPSPPQARLTQRQQPQQGGFFGVFPEVNLQ